NRDQRVVGHGAEGALDHQVEDAIVGKGARGVVERDVAEENPEAHQGEGRGETHHDDDDDQAEHQQAQHRFGHSFVSPPIPRWRAASSISWTRLIARSRDSRSTYWLPASCSSTTSISSASFRRWGHTPVLMHTTQRMISAVPCRSIRTPASGMTALK